MSYFFAAGAPRSPAATLTTRYGRPSAWRISSSIASSRSCSSPDALRLAEREQLDLVELVHAEHPARVLAGGAGLAAEVRRERRVAERQLRRGSRPCAAPRARPRTCRSGRGRRSRSRRCSTASVGKKPVPYIASSRTSTGGSIGASPCRDRRVEREAVEREREQRGVADEVAEARAGEPRGALHVEAADLACAPSARRAAAARRRGGSRPRRPRCRRRAPTSSGGFGTCASASSRAASAAASSCSARCSSSLTPRSSSSCSGVGLPFSFVCARSSSTRGTSARQRSSAASSASNASAAPLRASRRRNSSGSLRAARSVDHASESR